MRLLPVIILAMLPLVSNAGPLDDKTPAYFVDRYGPAKESNTASSHPFVHPGRGAMPIKGQFSVRHFRHDDLRVTAVFFLPSLKPAAIRLQLNRAWTSEQIYAALSAYGGNWEPIKKGGIVNTWIAPDGSMAINNLTWIDIQSKEVVDLTAKAIAESDAKRREIPKL